MTPATVERPGVWPTITKGWTDMGNDTAGLSTGDLETITAASWPLWWDLQSSGVRGYECDWIGS